MIRGSLVILALASALALNGCTQCSQQETAPGADTTAPAGDVAPEATPDPAMEMAPEGAEATPESTPVEGEEGGM